MGDGKAVLLTRIADCGNKTGVIVDPLRREYMNYRSPSFPSPAQLDNYRRKNPQELVHIDSRTVDTGEKKIFFGHAARHLITTTKRAHDATSGGAVEQIDGWYIDHESTDGNCAPDYIRTDPLYAVGRTLVMLPEVPLVNHTGPVPSGLAVKMTLIVKILRKDGTPSRTTTIEETVEELSDLPMNPSLFRLPSGFRENKSLLDGRRRLSHSR